MEKNTTKPLYKVLNEERSSGEWDNDLHDGQVRNGGITVGDFYSTLVSPAKIKANAKYTALAVNNLHHLAETLERVHKLLEEGETVGNMQDIIEEALTRIS